MKLKISILLLAIASTACTSSLPEEIQIAYNSLPEKVDFNFHIQPLLADRCYKCHGPDDNTREADLRLDIEEEAFAKLTESEGYALLKGNLKKSHAWGRIVSDDPEEIMPPPDSHLTLSSKEKALIAKWIRQGAEWKEHWAFLPVKQPKVPKMKEGKTNNEIDHFVLARLEEEGLEASSEADKVRLIRRVTMDLTGLPPTSEEIEAFMKDESPDAYEDLVDRLLTTDAHAERLAMEWLDVARFGDTRGMHFDAERYNWPWRDWVIKAFKENLPYDEFITWQMAGDLLPEPTREQRLATAFHRNHPSSAEGGVPNEEYRQKYVQDRTNTTATAFMGLTLECATCHDHKFDPISQKEYYQMTAFFNNLKERGMVSEFRIDPKGKGTMYASGPVMLYPDSENEQELKEVQGKIEALLAKLAQSRSEVEATKAFVEEISQEKIRIPKPAGRYGFESLRPYKTKDGVVHRIQGNAPVNKMVDNNRKSLACGNPEIVEGRFGNALRSPEEVDMVFLKDVGYFELNEPYAAGAWMKTEKEGENQSIMGTSGELGNAWRGWDLFIDSLNRPSIKVVSIAPHNYMQITADVVIPPNEWHQVYFTYDGSSRASGLKLFVDGKQVQSKIDYDNLYGTIIHRWRSRKEWKQRPMFVFRSGRYHAGENGVFLGSIDEVKVFDQYLTALQIQVIYAQETKEAFDHSLFDKRDYADHYLQYKHDTYRDWTNDLSELLAQKLEVLQQIPEIQIMEDMPGIRKTFVLDRGQYNAPREEVFPATPEVVLDFPDDLPKNRLGLAQWLVDEKNPLTARVAVNRYWQMIFGRGIVETPHDFGTQGALPSHPELLDWLAVDFVESKWDLRRLLKMMVMSATYRQSSFASPLHQEKDPKNIFLAHAPSYRMQAEMIRDNALAASGLLSRKIGGPSVKPYQPEGVWDFGVLASGPYEESTGEDLYRRSMYTYIRRTTPHPAMIAFDAPNRLVCTTKRENTNTPLQALVLLNDPQFVEAARVLAQRMQKEGGNDFVSQSEYGFKLLCGRQPNEKERKILQGQYEFAMNRFKDDPQQAEDFLEVGEYPLDPDLDTTQTAALAMVASTMMNFDEAYMKR